MNKIYQLADLSTIYYANFLEIINSQNFIFFLKAIFLIISLLLLILIAVLFKKTKWFKDIYGENLVEFVASRPYGVQKTFKDWGKIVSRIKGEKEEDYKMAIIEADDLLKEILLKMNFKGETMNDLLSQVDEKSLPSIEDVYYAHGLRNNIVHNPDYDLNIDHAKKSLKIYEQAFRDLQLF